MGTTKFQLVESEVEGQIDEENVIIQPSDRLQGFGVALKLSGAVQFARMILELESMLADEPVGIDTAHPMA